MTYDLIFWTNFCSECVLSNYDIVNDNLILDAYYGYQRNASQFKYFNQFWSDLQFDWTLLVTEPPNGGVKLTGLNYLFKILILSGIKLLRVRAVLVLQQIKCSAY